MKFALSLSAAALTFGMLFGWPASAAESTSEAAKAQSATAGCEGTQQDRATCLREAGAAKQERKSGGLTSPAPADEKKNALERCESQPPSARAECEARIQGTGKTSVEGSVNEGGIIRETTTPVPAPSR